MHLLVLSKERNGLQPFYYYVRTEGKAGGSKKDNLCAENELKLNVSL